METARGIAARPTTLPPKAAAPGGISEQLLLFQERLLSPEAAGAFAAFVEKRKPDFSQFS